MSRAAIVNIKREHRSGREITNLVNKIRAQNNNPELNVTAITPELRYYSILARRVYGLTERIEGYTQSELDSSEAMLDMSEIETLYREVSIFSHEMRKIEGYHPLISLLGKKLASTFIRHKERAGKAA